MEDDFTAMTEKSISDSYNRDSLLTAGVILTVWGEFF